MAESVTPTGRPAGRRVDFVQSLERGLAVIRAFDADHPDLTLSDVARRTGLTRAAARRFLLTLTELGYVRSDGRTFALRPRILELGYAYLSALGLDEVAAPHMEVLVAEIHESSSIAVLDGDDIVYVVRVPTQRIMTVAIAVGTRFPAHATSMGRVLLAALTPDDLDVYLGRADLVPLTRRTRTDPAELRALLGEVAAQGYALVDQELEDGLRSIAVPIRGDRGQVTAALNVSVHASRGTLDTLRRGFLPRLLEVAGRISADLRPSGPATDPRPVPRGYHVVTDTQVAIIGAGPAGLVLAHRLADAGVDAVILESRERSYVEARVRAGVLEAPTVGLLDEMGLAGRLHREGLVHHGVNLQWDGTRHRIDFAALTGKAVTVYGQQEVVKDLIAAWLARGGDLRFSTEVEAIDDVGTEQPSVRYRGPDGAGRIRCEIVAGCDGFHGVSRRSLAPGEARTYDREYPFAWLGILAEVAPSTDELIYACHERGFAMHSLRSPRISRLYLQVEPTDDIANWPDGRIWDELQTRLAVPGWSLREGPVVEKGITPMRSFVSEPMRHGRLFLAGDAAHIVPPTGAKGMNLAIADVKVLADALVARYARSETSGLDGYSDRCLRRVWRVQDFSTTMTTLLHVDPGDDAFGRRVQRARQDYIAASPAMAASLAENYVGLPLP